MFSTRIIGFAFACLTLSAGVSFARVTDADFANATQKYLQARSVEEKKDIIDSILEDPVLQGWKDIRTVNWMYSLFIQETDLTVLEMFRDRLEDCDRVEGPQDLGPDRVGALLSECDSWLHKTFLIGAIKEYPKWKDYLSPVIARNRDVRVLISAVETLLHHRRDYLDPGIRNWYDDFLSNDDYWQIRAATIEAVRDTCNAIDIQNHQDEFRNYASLLIGRLGGESGRLSADIVDSLIDIFRLERTLHDSVEKYSALFNPTWFSNSVLNPGRNGPAPPPPAANVFADFLGLPLVSKRIVLVLDVSTSMKSTVDAASVEPFRKYIGANANVRTRLDLVRELFRLFLEKAPANARFNVVFLHGAPSAMSTNLERADNTIKTRAMESFENQIALSSEAGDLTSVWDAITLSMTFSKRGENPVPDILDFTHFREGADTVILVTDGRSSSGRYVTANERQIDLVKELELYNKFRKIKFHAVAIPGADGTMLRNIASKTGGVVLPRG
ncbi:MAG: hypothetical protein NUW37_02355 [Planctomycetes bacterium]|nr:hypothetical protein [Planctomycetota bacterium]